MVNITLILNAHITLSTKYISKFCNVTQNVLIKKIKLGIIKGKPCYIGARTKRLLTNLWFGLKNVSIN